jgi:hypothetical protein
MKRITIELTDRRPVSIDPAEWPIIAEAKADNLPDADIGRREQAWRQGELTRWWIVVRQHADGRAIVAAGHERNSPDDWRGGEIVRPGADLADAIMRIGDWGDIPRPVVRAAIAALPAEAL